MTSTIFPFKINGEWDDDEIHFTLHAPFVYEDLEKDIKVVIPAGFVTDFNSVPYVAQWYFNPKDYMKAGLVHDWLYRYPDKYFVWHSKADAWIPASIPLDRAGCDDIHRRILDLEGCRWSKRQAAYAALRAGGWRPWNRYRNTDTTTSSGQS